MYNDEKDLMEEIDKLEDNSDGAVKNSKAPMKFENILILVILLAIVLCYFYFKNTTSLENVDIAEENVKDDTSFFEKADETIKKVTDEIEDDNESFFYDNGEEYEYTDYEISENNAIKEFEEQKKNIQIPIKTFNINDELVIALNNRNKEFVSDLNVYAIFYDGNNTPIAIDEYPVDVLESNLNYYIVFSDTPSNFERYDILITKDYYLLDAPNTFTKDISYNTSEDGYGDIVITGKNNSNTKIDIIDFSIVYYDENKNILDVELLTEFDISKNGTFEIEGYGIYNEKNAMDSDYASYEVNLVSAYSYSD